MDGYSRMEIMRMTDEDLRRILKEEGEKLPTYTVAMIVEELKMRAETPESAYEEIDDEVNEADEESAENGEDDGDEDGTDCCEEPQEPEADDLELSPEERLQKQIEDAEKLKKERGRMLVIASVAAVATALLIVGFMLYLHFSGQL